MPSKKKVTYGPTVKKRAKRLLEALLAYVNGELEDVDGIDLSYRWQDETTQQPKLVIETKLRILETLTAKDNHEGKLTKDEIRRSLKDHLKDFLHILEDNRTKTQGEEDWHFTLTLWSRDKEKNLEQFEIEWEKKRPEKSKQQEETLRETVVETADETRTPEDQAPDWREICTNLLDEEAQRRQATGYGIGHEVNIYVPLGLVKPKQQPRRGAEDADPIRGMQQYQLQGEKEIEKRYAHQEFLDQVIGKNETVGAIRWRWLPQNHAGVGTGALPLQASSDNSRNYQHQNLAIIGEPGAGKTTWLQQIVRYLSSTAAPLAPQIWGEPESQSPDNTAFRPPNPGGTNDSFSPQDWGAGGAEVFPIWIPLANLGEFTLEEYLLNRWLKDAFPNQLEAIAAQKQALVDLFNRGKVWLLLDGVDEMKTANPLTQISQSLTGWVKQARVVLTCRLNVWEANPNTLPEFDTYRTLCFAGEQVNDFISQWFRDAEKPELGEQLQGKLAEAESARIFDLVKNPLRLSLLCKAWWLNPGTLPTTQADLYQQFRNDFYGWKQQEFPTSWSQREELNRRLGQLAFRTIAEKSPLRQSLVYAVLSEEWFKLAEKLGWLNLVYRDIRTDEPIYAFFHLTFQEYFAALAVDDWDEFLPRTHVDRPVEGKEYNNSQVDDEQSENLSFPRQNLSFPRRRESTIPGTKPQYRIFQPQWKQVILLWLGRGDVADERKEEFIQALVKFQTGCYGNLYLYRAYFLAAAGIDEFKTCSLADAIVQQIVKWGFGYYNQEKQQWRTFLDPIEEGARETLPQTDRQRAIQELCQILEHPQCSEDPRRQAASSLEKIDPGNQTAIAALVKLLETTEDEFTRSRDAESLEKIDPGNQTAIAGLVKFLETTKDGSTRWSAAKSLRIIGQGNERAIAALVKIIETTENEKTRWQAADSLGEIDPGNETAIAQLVRVIETTENEYTRRQAAESLGKIDPGNETAIAGLVKLLETTESEDTRVLTESSLVNIITTDENRKTVVTALQPHLNDETYENNFNLYKNCYQILWNIAQDLPYLDFYRAWHDETSPLVQRTCQLPQNLPTQLTATNLNQTLQIFCIDGSKFIGDNPTKTIYRQMTQQGSPKIDEKPKNMADLQDYWADLIDGNDKHPVLIFYEDPSPPNPQGFSPNFLDNLTRFEGIICLITDQTHPELKTFSSQEPQLIDNIIAWLERTILER